jgi:hypothetical protein
MVVAEMQSMSSLGFANLFSMTFTASRHVGTNLAGKRQREMNDGNKR